MNEIKFTTLDGNTASVYSYLNTEATTKQTKDFSYTNVIYKVAYTEQMSMRGVNCHSKAFRLGHKIPMHMKYLLRINQVCTLWICVAKGPVGEADFNNKLCLVWRLLTTLQFNSNP